MSNSQKEEELPIDIQLDKLIGKQMHKLLPISVLYHTSWC